MPDAPTLGQSYRLTVHSQNSKVTHFALYQKLPVTVGPSVDAISLAWIVGTAAPGTNDNPSDCVFEWTIAYSVATGYIQIQGTPDHPRRFSATSQKDVLIESRNKLSIVASPDQPDVPGVPYFPSDATDGTKGEVQILSDGSIPTDASQVATKRSLMVGLAMDKKIAVATELLPNILHQFTPHPSYFILAGAFVQGQVVDLSTTTAPFEVVFGSVTEKAIVFTERNQFQNA